MKFIVIAFFAFISTGCVAGEQLHKEKMYDLSSKFKDLAQSADGIVKFDHEFSKLDISILQYMQVKYPEKIKPFDGYKIKESVEGKNVVLLLCNDSVALVEDAGCSAAIDKHYWNQSIAQSCDFTIDSKIICN